MQNYYRSVAKGETGMDMFYVRTEAGEEWEASCDVANCGYDSLPVEILRAPIRWRVRIDRQRQRVQIINEYVSGSNFKKAATFDASEACQNIYQQRYILLDFSNSKVIYSPDNRRRKLEKYGKKTNNIEKYFFYDWRRNMVLPERMTKMIEKILKEFALQRFGFIPNNHSFSEEKDRLMYLEALTEYPLDISVKPIVDLVGWRLKRRLSPYMDSCFEIACDELGIAPIKSLRREYKKDGRVLLLCKQIQSLGIEDYNAWQDLYDVRRFANQDWNRWWIDSVNKVRARKYENGTSAINSSFYSMSLINKCVEICRKYRRNDVAVARFIKSVVEKYSSEQWDTVDMLKELRGKKLEECERYLLNHGFNRETHDYIMREVNRIRMANTPADILALLNGDVSDNIAVDDSPFAYDEQQKGLEWQQEQWKISLPESPSTLWQIGSEMSICVGIYTDNVRSGFCTVYTLTKGDDLVACIEVREQELMQFKGYHNNVLPEEQQKLCIQWCQDKKIKFADCKDITIQ